MIVITAVFRFNTPGELCSLSTSGVYYTGQDKEYEGIYANLDEKWTYARDGELLLNVLIAQIVIFPLICCLGPCTYPSIQLSQDFFAEKEEGKEAELSKVVEEEGK